MITADTLTSRPAANPSTNAPRRYLGVQGLATYYGVSERTVWRRIKDGTIVSVRLGEKTLGDVVATDARLQQAA